MGGVCSVLCRRRDSRRVAGKLVAWLLVVLVVGVEILSLFVVFRLWRVFASGWLWC